MDQKMCIELFRYAFYFILKKYHFIVVSVYQQGINKYTRGRLPFVFWSAVWNSSATSSELLVAELSKEGMKY